jgi:hypothetical protein
MVNFESAIAVAAQDAAVAGKAQGLRPDLAPMV